MALLMEHQFRQLPADRQVETRPFLETVSHLPPFFGKFLFKSNQPISIPNGHLVHYEGCRMQ